MPLLFWIITFIVLLFVAFLITQMIMKPIKRRRENRQWNQWKKRNELMFR